MKKIIKNLRNQKGSSNVEIIVLLTAIILVAMLLLGMTNIGFKEVLAELGTTLSTEAEQTTTADAEAKPLDVFSQMAKDVEEYKSGAGYMTTDERQTAGYGLMERLDVLLEQAEIAGNQEVVEQILTQQITVEKEMNYGL